MRVSAFQMHLTIECPTLVYIDSMSWNIILLLELTWSDLQNNQQCRYSRAIVIRFEVVRLVVRAQECYTLGGRVSHECHSAHCHRTPTCICPPCHNLAHPPFPLGTCEHCMSCENKSSDPLPPSFLTVNVRLIPHPP